MEREKTTGRKMNPELLKSLLGGVLIGTAVSMMLLFNGRVTGISGIISGAMFKPKEIWRWAFLLGLLAGGFILNQINSSFFSGFLLSDWWTNVVAGILVGFGTLLGSGCTSGHGVCGISRLSVRSIVATITFIISGMVSVYVFRKLGFFI